MHLGKHGLENIAEDLLYLFDDTPLKEEDLPTDKDFLKEDK